MSDSSNPKPQQEQLQSNPQPEFSSDLTEGASQRNPTALSTSAQPPPPSTEPASTPPQSRGFLRPSEAEPDGILAAKLSQSYSADETRRHMPEIQHSFEAQGDFVTRAIANDDAVAAREIHAELERHRLHTRTPVAIPSFAQYVDICVREGPFCVFVQRTLMLRIAQSGVATRSKIVRRVQIIHMHESLYRVAPTVETSDESNRELERTKRQVQGMPRR
jgi:hypothetical protein